MLCLHNPFYQFPVGHIVDLLLGLPPSHPLYSNNEKKQPTPIKAEGNPAFIIGFIALTVLAEIIRKANGYDTLKGVRFRFISFAYSFYAYSFYAYTAHWWTDTQGSLAAAVEEIPSGYADKMLPVINNIPVLIIALVLVIPVALPGMKLAGKIMKKSAALLK